MSGKPRGHYGPTGERHSGIRYVPPREQRQQGGTNVNLTEQFLIVDKLRADLVAALARAEVAERERDAAMLQIRDAHNALTSFGVPCEPHQPHDGCDTQLGHRVRLVLAKLSAFSADADAVQNTALDRIAIVKDALETAERERDDAVQAVAEYLSTCNAVLAEHQSVNRLLIAERDAARAQVRTMIGTTTGYKPGCHCNGCRAIAAALGEDCNEPR